MLGWAEELVPLLARLLLPPTRPLGHLPLHPWLRRHHQRRRGERAV